jgi:hypothetical protein
VKIELDDKISVISKSETEKVSVKVLCFLNLYFSDFLQKRMTLI